MGLTLGHWLGAEVGLEPKSFASLLPVPLLCSRGQICMGGEFQARGSA